jgi:DoxX-like family
MFITLSLLLAATCLVAALGKLTSQPKMVASASHFGIPWERYRLIGVAELAAAAGVVVGLTWIWIGVAAAVGMVVVLLGALLVHRRAGDHLREAVPAVIGLGVCVGYLALALAR